MATIGLVLLAAAVVGVSALAFMLGLTVWHVRRPGLVPTEWPGISVLKPLCGNDDDLAANIASFADLPYGGEYEVVLGARSPEDPAWPVAAEAVRRWPQRMRLVRQEREVWLNPKVNQLVGMARAAQHAGRRGLQPAPARALQLAGVRGVRPDGRLAREPAPGALGEPPGPVAGPTRSGVVDVTGFSEKLPSLHGPAAALMSDLRA